MACDICGSNKESLTDLKPEYHTGTIKQVCSPCLKILNDHLWAVRKLESQVTKSWFQRFMENLREKHRGMREKIQG